MEAFREVLRCYQVLITGYIVECCLMMGTGDWQVGLPSNFPPAPAIPPPGTIDPAVMQAMSTGNSSNVTISQLRAAISTISNDSTTNLATLTYVPWTGLAAGTTVSWNPGGNSDTFRMNDWVNTGPLLTANVPNDGTARYISIGGNALTGR